MRVGNNPQGLSLSPDGKRLAVTSATSHHVDLLNLRGRLLKRFKVGKTPYAPLFSPDGRSLVVTNRFGRTLSFVGPGNTQRQLVVEKGGLIARFSPDGEQLALVHFDSSWLSFID